VEVRVTVKRFKPFRHYRLRRRYILDSRFGCRLPVGSFFLALLGGFCKPLIVWRNFTQSVTFSIDITVGNKPVDVGIWILHKKNGRKEGNGKK
jgi:hypothetical protein